MINIIHIADKFVKILHYKMFKKLKGMIKRLITDMAWKVKKIINARGLTNLVPRLVSPTYNYNNNKYVLEKNIN